MRFTVVALLAGLFALALAGPTFKISDKQVLEKQKDILRLFKHVNQPSYYKDHVEIAQSFNIQEHYDDYTKAEVAKQYHKIYKYGLLPRGEIFSVFYEEHLKQAIALFKVLYYAKDYETFYNTAVWARQNVNEGVYLYAVSVAIVHRPDTQGIVLPPIYEVYPYYFYNNEVIQQVYKYKQQYYGKEQQGQNEQEKYKGYTVNANYSGHYLNLHPEQSISYFTEDVGINAFYYYYNIYYPYWMKLEEYGVKNERRGEQYYHIYQQILARYYLERLSNGFGEIPVYNYDVPVETGYYPSLQYPNGLPFPTRPNHANLHEYFYNYGQKYGNNKYAYSYTLVQDYERRIRDAIDRGYVYTRDGQRVNINTEQGINILGNLIQATPESPDTQYYGKTSIYARHLLGYSYQPLDKYKVAPSALEHYETSLRDPAFYQFYKRIVLYFQKYQNNLKSYTEEDLTFDGVEVKNVEFDRLITYFDYFYTDLTNAAYVTAQEYQQQYEQDKIQVRARQYRLNHKPFTYKINVQSDKAQEAVVRVYIGPKYDEYDRQINISQNRVNFVHFDHFRYQLKQGENVIVRNSHEIYGYQDDRTSYKQLYQQVLQAVKGNGEVTVQKYGFPRRFLLPKGTYGGYEYQFYVIVSSYVPYQGKQQQQQQQQEQENKQQQQQQHGELRAWQFIDGYPLGYPFDRPVHYDQIYEEIPNAYTYTAKIYHRQVDDINASTSDRE